MDWRCLRIAQTRLLLTIGVLIAGTFGGFGVVSSDLPDIGRTSIVFLAGQTFAPKSICNFRFHMFAKVKKDGSKVK